MGAAHHAVSVSASVAHNHHRQAMQAHVVADLLEGPGIDEGRNAVHPGTQVLPRQPGGHRDHVLLRDAGIDKAGAHRVAQRLKRIESQIAREKYEIATIRLRNQRLTKLLSHDAVTSPTARAYCS